MDYFPCEAATKRWKAHSMLDFNLVTRVNWNNFCNNLIHYQQKLQTIENGQQTFEWNSSRSAIFMASEAHIPYGKVKSKIRRNIEFSQEEADCYCLVKHLHLTHNRVQCLTQYMEPSSKSATDIPIIYFDQLRITEKI
jgi:hypothetical protein